VFVGWLWAWLSQPLTRYHTETVHFLSRRAGPNFHVGSRLAAHNAVIRVYDAAGNVIETHEHKGDFREW